MGLNESMEWGILDKTLYENRFNYHKNRQAVEGA